MARGGIVVHGKWPTQDGEKSLCLQWFGLTLWLYINEFDENIQKSAEGEKERTNQPNKQEEQSKNKNKDEPTQNWNRQLLRVYQQEGLLMSQSTVPSFTSKERNKKSQHSNDSYLAYYYQTSLKSSVTYNKHPKSVGYSMPLWLWKTIEAIKNVQSCSV